MSSNARDRIAERVKNAYAAGYNDGRKGLDRMDTVAETETAKILEVVREVLTGPREWEDMKPEHFAHIDAGIEKLRGIGINSGEAKFPPYGERDAAVLMLDAMFEAAFGADDDGGER